MHCISTAGSASSQSPRAPLGKADFEALSEFRYQLRRFLHFSEEAARAEGLTPVQYQLMLHIKGFPGREWASVGELAERLQTRQHGVVTLVSRCERAGLLVRTPDETDRRRVQVRLMPEGEKRLRRLAERHREELLSLTGVIGVARISALDASGLNASVPSDPPPTSARARRAKP